MIIGAVLRFPVIADAMPRNCLSQLRQFLHFVENNPDHDSDDKSFKIKSIMEAVTNECVSIEQEQLQSVDEQIILSKSKFTKIRQYNPKKPTKRGFENLVRAGSSGFTYDFYIYSG